MTKRTWVNLHSHDIWSLLDGYGTQEKYAARAVELGQPALATTNHGNLFGIYKHYKTCKEFGIKPILGIELYEARKTRFDRDEEERAGPSTTEWGQRGPHHLTVIAKNFEGYKNLIKLSSRAYLEGYYVKPRADNELLSDHAEGLIVGSGCLSGRVQQALLRGDYDAALLEAATRQEVLGKENYFIEIMNHGIAEELAVLPDLIRIAKTIGAPIVPTNDTHYVNKEDHDFHDVMLCVGTKATVAQENRFRFDAGAEFYLKSYEEMERLFEPEWLKNTLDVAEMCDVEIEFGKLFFPSFPDVPPNMTPDEFFVAEAWRGMHQRFGETLPGEYEEQAKYEIGVIQEMGFQEYFLVVSDLIRAAKENGVHIGWGRGSAAASVIAYAMQITNLDPLKFGLLFERFLTPGRVSMPDIDIDTDDREWMINYSKAKYGSEKVAQISTFARVKPKSAIRDAARVLGYESSVGDKLAKLVPPAVLGVEKTMKEALASPDMHKEYESNADSRKILDAAAGLEGLVRQPGVHAAGVVIAQSDITDFIPVMASKEGGDTIVTQCDMYEVEDLGLLKIDFLGLRNLWVIADCIDRVAARQNIFIDQDAVDLEDPTTYKMLQAGHSIGVFQVEGGGMRQIMMELRPDSIYDIMALIALYRPGPMGSGMHKMYIDRKRGRAKIEPPHPMLYDDLENSLGIMLYQEDVLRVITKLAGWSVGEADDMRRVIGKKKMDKVALYREGFVQGCIDTNNVPKALADKIFSDIEYFAGYGFNLAHSASYAMVSYMTAYLKANYPTEYMASLMTSVATKAEKLAFYLRECNRMGIQVLPPSISKSESDFSIEDDGVLRFGLSGIAGVGESIIDNLKNSAADYSNMYDFFRKTDPLILNSGTIGKLAKSGALDELITNAKDIRLNTEIKREFLMEERSSLGVFLTEHPLDGVIHAIEPLCDSTVYGLHEKNDGETVKIGGIISGVTKKTTKRGQGMAILKLEDLTGDLEVLVFPKVYDQWADAFVVGDIVVMEGRLSREEVQVDADGDEIEMVTKLFFSGMTVPELPESSGKPIILHLTNKPTYDMIMLMNKLVVANPGDSQVFLQFEENGRQISLKFNGTADYGIKEDLETMGVLDAVTQ